MAINYENPLDAFRSYSYHYIMSVSDQSKAFESILGGNGGAPYFASVAKAAHPGAKIELENGEPVWLVLDTRRFSAYQISRVEMEHMYGTGLGNNPSSPINTFSMQVIDTTGISFFNMLIDLFRNKIRSTRDSAFFALSIVFVGHRYDGTTEIVSKTNIPLMMISMGFSVDHRGSVYDIEFMEMDGGPQKGGAMSHVNSLGSIMSVTSEVPGGASNTSIGAMINNLEWSLNVQGVKAYRDSAAAAANAGKSLDEIGKLVQHMITIPREWENFPCTAAGRAKNIEQKFIAGVTAARKQRDETQAMEAAAKKKPANPADKDAQAAANEALVKAQRVKVDEEAAKVAISDQSTYTQMSFASSMTVSDAVKSILESSVDILELASEKRRLEGTAKTFKIITSITSDANSYVVHTDVHPYSYPPAKSAAPPAGETNLPAGENAGVVDLFQSRNHIRYDYIFTGKNNHILDFKIKFLPESAIALDTSLDLGMSRTARTAATAGQSAAAHTKASQSPVKDEGGSAAPVSALPADPRHPPVKSPSQSSNVVHQKTEGISEVDARRANIAAQEAKQTMSMLSFLSSIDVDLTIRGNPNIIAKFADRDHRGGFTPHPTTMGQNDIPALLSAKDETNAYHKVIADRHASAKSSYIDSYILPRINPAPGSKPNDSLLGGPDISIEPIFCSVNIKVPDVDYVTGEPVDKENPYTNSFFYNDPYMVMSVKTILENGEFTHELNLIPYVVKLGMGAEIATDGAGPAQSSSVAPSGNAVTKATGAPTAIGNVAGAVSNVGSLTGNLQLPTPPSIPTPPGAPTIPGNPNPIPPGPRMPTMPTSVNVSSIPSLMPAVPDRPDVTSI